jgi:acetyl esterase/lipase
MTKTLSEASGEIDIRKDLVYATHDGVELAGDLYRPPGAGPFPVLVAVHGGGWRVGARSSFQYWGPYLAARGYALYTISYRLAGKGKTTHPQAVNDVCAAVQFVRGEAKAFNLDPARVALMGASAGAHLSSLAALSGETFAKAYPGDKHAAVSPKVKALVGVYGVYDLTANWVHFQSQMPTDNPTDIFMGTTPVHDRKLYFEASPISYATLASNSVSVFLSWGTEDDLVDRTQQSEAFLLALKQAGFFARTAVVQGAPHYWMSDPIDEPGSFSGFLAPRLVRFLAERL